MNGGAGTIPPRPLAARLLWAAVGLGMGARFWLSLERPLWADETFTLAMARRSAAEILAVLHVDSGPPLHYLLCRLLLLPFPSPGAADLAVRLLSVAASLLHVPLFLAAARREGNAPAGLRAAALFSLMPLAAWYGSEGRGYALASLLLLLAFERTLAVRAGAGERPSLAPAVVAGVAAGAAVLSHYLALFPLAGIAIAVLPSRGRPRRLHLLSAGIALLLVLPWAPVALSQPRASMRWVAPLPAWRAAPRAVANLLLGADGEGAVGLLLAAAAALALVLAVRASRDGSLAAGALLAGGGLLLAAGLAVPELLLPERCGVPFLPLAALTLAVLPGEAAFAAGAAGLVLGASSLAGWTAPTLSSDLGARLLAVTRPGERVVAGGLWGPELRYRFERAGRPGEVLVFPSDLDRHPGWYDEGGAPQDRLRAEASALSEAGAPPRWWIVPAGTRTAAPLRAEAARLGGQLLAATPYYEIWRVPGGGSGLRR